MKKRTLVILFFVGMGLVSLYFYWEAMKIPPPSRNFYLSEEATTPKKTVNMTMVPKVHERRFGAPDLEPNSTVETTKERAQSVIHHGSSSLAHPAKTIAKETPFPDYEELSPEERKERFEEEMTAGFSGDETPEEIFRESMYVDKMEKMSEEEKKKEFFRSMGGTTTPAERKKIFEDSMGIRPGKK